MAMTRSLSALGPWCALFGLTAAFSLSGTWQLSAQDSNAGVSAQQAELLKQIPSLRDLDSHCPFTPPKTLEDWQVRSAQLKQQLLVSLGLWPLPKMEPVAPKIYGRLPLDGYTIEKVTFETLPGFYVTGNLYRPDPMPAGKVPGVLCPHGHWAEARFYDLDPKGIQQLLATGAERFENAARNHIQARCVHLARMGCVVFHWDMIGYCDNQQINFERSHRFAKQPKESEVAADGWLLFSPLAESHAQSILGLQTLAGMRGVDFLLTLPEVDSARIGITGASGGGTQSFITAAVDPRIAVAFPAVMVSTGMQGGCTCENAAGLRTGTGNVEMASLIAPRPMGLTTANDWTKNMPTDGFPELQQLYGLLGAKDKVALFPAAHFPHNYNHVARVSMYGWMNKHFKLGLAEPVLERDFVWKGKADLTVWDAEHPQPEGGEAFERKLMKSFRDNIDAQFTAQLAAGQAQALGETLLKGWEVCLGLTHTPVASASMTGQERGNLQFTSATDGQWQLRAGEPAAGAKLLVRVPQAKLTYAVALLGQDFAADGSLVELAQQPLVGNPRLAAAYTYGFNEPLFARRARQLGATLKTLQQQHPTETLVIEGQGAAAALAAAGVICAGVSKPESVQLRLAPAGFRFAKVDSIRDPNFLPASARYWDVPGLVSCVVGQVELIDQDKADFLKLQPVAAARGSALR